MLHYLQNLFQALDVSSLTDAVLRVAAVFLCLTVHETCHGLAALALGDPTAKSMHRLSLNPLHHIDWLGLALMFTVGFGWAKPVPINPRYFRHFNRDMMLTALAGPASNLLQAIGWAVVLKLVVMLGISERFVISVCAAGISVNLMLMAFNLIPIPPLDGGRILFYIIEGIRRKPEPDTVLHVMKEFGSAKCHTLYVGDSDVGQRVNFGCGTVTTNYDGHKKFRCTIGDDVFLGCNTNLIAPVTVGDRAYTAAGSTVTDDVPDGALAIARARQTNKPGWADRLHSLWKKDK